MALINHIRRAAVKGWLGEGFRERELLRRLRLGRAIIQNRVDDLRVHDPYTKDHCEKVAQYALKFAQDWSLPPVVQEQWYASALLHDIGKLLVPLDVINSTTKLTDEQWQIMKLHTLLGELLIRGPVVLEEHPDLRKYFESRRLPVINQRIPGIFQSRPELSDVIMLDGLDHHERPNGTGYPKGKRSDQVSTLARVIAVVDTYDALTSDRSYRRPETSQSALQKLEEGAAKGDYDPIIVTKFKEWITDVEATLKGYAGRATLSVETVVNDRLRDADKILKRNNKYYSNQNPLQGLNASERSRVLESTLNEMRKLYSMVDEESLQAIVYHAARFPHKDDITTKDITLSMDELRARVEEAKEKAAKTHHVEIVLDITNNKLRELANRSIVVYQGKLCDKIIVSNQNPSRIALMYRE